MKKRMLAMVMAAMMALSLLPASALAAGNPFADVKTTAWYYDEVQYVYENGLMNGTSSTTFSPDSTTTRGMIVTILYRLEKEPAVSGDAPFTDVEADQWYADAVNWAAANKVVNGTTPTTFAPNNSITREQMAAILYRYAQYKEYDVSGTADLSGYLDASSISEYAVSAMQWANKAELITGVTENTLVPQGYATRAQVAAILYRFCTTMAGVTETYTVTFDYNYTDAEADKTVSVKDGDTVSAPEAPSRSGYTFDGWFTKAEGGSKFDFKTAVTGDVTLYAHWSVKNTGGGGGGSTPADPKTVSSVAVVDGADGFTEVTVPRVGQVLRANVKCSDGTEIGSYPVNEDAEYTWYYKESPDAVLGTEPSFTVTTDNLGKTLCVKVTVEGYNGEAVWEAAATPDYEYDVKSVAVVDGTDGFTEVTIPRVGQVLRANVKCSDGTEIGSYPVNEDAEYTWYYKESPDAVLGTEPSFTVTTDNLGKTLCVKVTVEGYNGEAVWEAAATPDYEYDVKSVAVVDGTDGFTEVTIPRVGQVLRANVKCSDGTEIGSYPVNEDAEYTWYYKESPDAVLGTEPSFTVTTDNLGKTLCVKVTVEGYNGEAVWEADDVIVGARIVYSNGDANDVATINVPGMTVTPSEDGATVTFAGEVAKSALADLTELPTDDSAYNWAEDVAFTYAYFKLPEGADYVNFGEQITVPSNGLIALDNQTTDGQVVQINGERYYKMVIQFAHKTTGLDWGLSVGANNPDNIVNYEFTVGSVAGDVYTAALTYKLTLDYSGLTIVDDPVTGNDSEADSRL